MTTMDSCKRSCLLAMLLLATARAQIDERRFQCDVTSDTCPFRFDGRCDLDGSARCGPNTDCYDCDPCRSHDYDCSSCLAMPECRWCPGDGICSSFGYKVNLSPVFGNKASCTFPNDWSADTCAGERQDTNVFNDPLYTAQSWVYEQISIEPIWRRGFTGKGIHVRINDNGIDPNHPEFAGRFDVANSCDEHIIAAANEAAQQEPEPIDGSDQHGMLVASIVGAAADNDLCAAGIAPEATLSACNAFTTTNTLAKANAFAVVDISQNSYGVVSCNLKDRRRKRRKLQTCPFNPDTAPCFNCDFSLDEPDAIELCAESIANHCRRRNNYNEEPACEEYLEHFTDCVYGLVPTNTHQSIEQGINFGRGGLGTIYVFASGNYHKLGGEVSMEGFLNTRYTISVGATDKLEKRAPYSQGGAALFVSAPGGDLNGALTNHVAAVAGGGCGHANSGTSFACPVVSGVIAVMLEANGNMSWRDVQGVLATTSRPPESGVEDETQTVNGAGIWHSHDFGFGIVNAERAVDASLTWESYGEEVELLGDSGPLNVPLLDDDSVSITSILFMDAEENFVIESVVVELDIVHDSRGDLRVVITSPHGTESEIHPGFRPESSQLTPLERWDMLTVRSWGETARGNWTLSIADVNSGTIKECIDSREEYVISDRSYTCYDMPTLAIGGESLCSDESVQDEMVLNMKASDGSNPSQGCCVCGGGSSVTPEDDRLVSWQLRVFGHYSTTVIPNPPSSIPSTAPSSSPSASPSNRLSAAPSSPPSLSPTLVSTKLPSRLPTDQPSPSPVQQPTTVPLQPTTEPIQPPPISTNPAEDSSTRPSTRVFAAATILGLVAPWFL